MKSVIMVMGLIASVLCAPAFSAGDVEAGKQKATTCFACHGPTGNTNMSEWPKIAQQHQEYTVKQLMAFKAGKEGGRFNETMLGIAQPLSTQDMEDIAAYFETQAGTIGEAQPEFVELGQALYRGGNMEKGIPACMACHGPKGNGIGSADFPRLAGQNVDYVVLQLKAFRSGERTNDLNQMMQLVAQKLTDEDIQAVASYIHGLH